MYLSDVVIERNAANSEDFTDLYDDEAGEENLHFPKEKRLSQFLEFN